MFLVTFVLVLQDGYGSWVPKEGRNELYIYERKENKWKFDGILTIRIGKRIAKYRKN